MRRGMPRGRGGNTSKGPLITNHLQGLRDIDLELELLKRKRQLMEEQHQLLHGNEQQYTRQRNDYQQPLSNQHFNPNHDYSYLYEDPQESITGRKRPVISVWEDEVPSKRFSGPNRGNVKKTFGNRTGSGSIPRFELPSQRSQLNQHGFNLPWNQSAPSTSQRPRPFPKKPQSLTSFKFKTNSSSRKPDFKPKKVTKPLQPVKVVDTYRQLYASSAAECKMSVAEASPLVTKVAVTSNAFPVLRADEIPTQQMTGRLELALGKIMKEIKQAYEARYQDIFSSPRYQRIMKQAIRERIKSVMLGKPVGSANEILIAYRDSFPNESDKDIVDQALAAKDGPKLLITPIDSDDPATYFKSNMHRLVDVKLNEMFTKLEGMYLKEYSNLGENKSAYDSANIANVNVQESNDWTDDVVFEDAEKDDSKMSIPPKFNYIEKLMAQTIPTLLKKNIPFIINLMKLDHMYKETVAMIKKETSNKLLPKETRAEKTNEQILVTEVNDTVNAQKLKVGAVHNLPYYVKVFSRPYLPKKDLMQNFLQQFNPKSIKKHKNVNNLLFVGFDNEHDFQNILAATGSNIGRFKLDIKVSERANDKSDKLQKADAEIGAEIKTEVLSFDDKIFSPEIDNQITDLLSSIEKSDEQETDPQQESIETDKPTEEVETNSAETVPPQTEVTQTNTSEATSQIQVNNSQVDNHDENTTCEDKSHDNTTDIQATMDTKEMSQNHKVKEQETPETCEEMAVNDDETNKSKPMDDNEHAQPKNEQKEPQENAPVDINEPDKPKDEQKTSQKRAPIDKNEPEKLKDEQKVPQENTQTLDIKNIKKLESIAETTEDGQLKTARLEALKSEMKESGRTTPTRSSSRLAAVTPSTIKTRRASRLAQNNSS